MNGRSVDAKHQHVERMKRRNIWGVQDSGIYTLYEKKKRKIPILSVSHPPAPFLSYIVEESILALWCQGFGLTQ